MYHHHQLYLFLLFKARSNILTQHIEDDNDNLDTL